ncbi:MAG: aminotransferase class V-fold PLP-dependent enzyme [Gammaproteobacteria bacterium]|nr:aminotransferase class V-fold PLP-dependent enzyme [Gammaproteobacteria bacterium]
MDGDTGSGEDFGMDVSQLRQMTPGCLRRIHFNNAGASLPTTQTLTKVVDYLQREAEIGGYEAAREANDEIEATYSSIARLINAAPDEIALMESSTRAWDSIFYSIPFQPGERILTGRSEYASNYIAMLQLQRRCGIDIDVIEDDTNGQIDLDQLSRSMSDDVRLVALTQCPTNNGLINPAVEVGQIVKPYRAWYLLDACQAVGQLKVDVKETGCDFLTATGRKFLRAPRGTGFLYVRRELITQIEPSQMDMRAAFWTAMNEYQIRDDARRFETWETSHALRLGLKSAVDQLLALGVEPVSRRIQQLAERLRLQLQSIEHIRLQDKGIQQSGIVTFSSDRFGTCKLESTLMAAGINISVSPLKMARLDMEPRGLIAVIRASVHIYNTEEEIDQFCQALISI